MKGLAWYVARRYLSSRRKGWFLSLITVIAVLGVAVGVMALMVVIAVMTGLQRDLQAKILGSTPHIYVFQQNVGFRLGDWETVLDEVRNTPGVTAAQPFMMVNSFVVPLSTGGSYAQPGLLYGIEAGAGSVPMTELEQRIRDGEFRLGTGPGGLPAVLVGGGLANRLRLLEGDTIVIATVENNQMVALGGFNPAMRQFEVTGIFTTGMYEYDEKNLYADMAPVQDLIGVPPDTVSGIAANVGEAWDVAPIRERLQERLEFPYYVQDWTQLNGSLFSALRLEKLALAVILSLIILVAAFNIVSTLIMVVRDKTREIGILKSIGMTDRTVQRIFILQGLTIGVVGTLLGAASGILLIVLLDDRWTLPGDVYFISKLPLQLDVVDGVLIVVLSVLIALLATIYPAWRASRLMPVEAIRHD